MTLEELDLKLVVKLILTMTVVPVNISNMKSM